MSIYERLADLKAKYPDDIEQIEEEERRVADLLRRQEYYEQPVTKELLTEARGVIVKARMKLATERTLDEQARQDLWCLIDARDWFIRMVAKDYAAELEQIDRELETELSRAL